ncbi:MAG: hypothetical protein KC492_14540 [Myxococcales bacterium]|nr:hypothetical protein [Myxococcales bacterium]
MRAISAHTRLERAAVWLLVLSPFLAAVALGSGLAIFLGCSPRSPAWWGVAVLYLGLSWFSLVQADFWIHMDDWDHDRYTLQGVVRDLRPVWRVFLWFWSFTGFPTLLVTTAVVVVAR